MTASPVKDYQAAVAEAFSALTSGHMAEAEKALRAIIDRFGPEPDAAFLLGSLLQRRGECEEAVDFLRHAKGARDTDPAFHFTLADALNTAGRHGEAEAHYRRLTELGPDNPKHWNLLGKCLHAQLRHADAEPHLRRAAEAKPDDGPLLNDLGLCVQEQGRNEDAREIFARISALMPNSAGVHYNLGNALFDLRRPEDAIASYRRAIELEPKRATAHLHLAYAHLIQGHFEAAWPEYEWRWRAGVNLSHWQDFKTPLWDGGELGSKTLAVFAEQGLGDTLQFCRFIPQLLDRYPEATVLLYTQAPLARLISTLSSSPRLTVLPLGAETPEYDLRLPLMSLPGRLGISFADIESAEQGARAPYLRAPADAVDRFAPVLGACTGLKVGIAWAAFAERRGSSRRSCPLADLGPLLEVSGVSFINLQKDIPAEETPLPDALLDPMNMVEDFADTAGLVSHLDLVISVDTATVHLAGALRVPVWVMVPHAGDWRWFLDRDDSPWYPTAKLFRQDVNGEWDDVVSRVRDALAALAAVPA